MQGKIPASLKGGYHFAQNHFAPDSRILHVTEMLKKALIGILKFIAALPLPVVQGIGRFVGFVFGRVLRHHRTDAFLQLERSMPELSPKECTRIINSMYSLQGVNMLEMLWYSLRGKETIADGVKFEGLEHYEEAMARGKGVLWLSAHFNNYELIPMAASTFGCKLSTVVKRIKNETINEVVEVLRNHEGLTFLPSKNAYKDCLKALRRNESVGMIIDQNMTRDEGVFIDFFGKPACSSPGLAYMAAQSKAPILPAFIHRNPNGTFVIKVLPLIDPPTDRKPETIHAATQQYNKLVEDVIRESPEHWIWMHRRWKTVPQEGDSLVERAKD